MSNKNTENNQLVIIISDSSDNESLPQKTKKRNLSNSVVESESSGTENTMHNMLRHWYNYKTLKRIKIVEHNAPISPVLNKITSESESDILYNDFKRKIELFNISNSVKKSSINLEKYNNIQDTCSDFETKLNISVCSECMSENE